MLFFSLSVYVRDNKNYHEACVFCWFMYITNVSDLSILCRKQNCYGICCSFSDLRGNNIF